jgi:transposase InsO family protein
MPWNEKNLMDLRREFVALASVEDANRTALCERFGISRKTGYKWLRRAAEGPLADRSRRPLHTPGRTAAQLEEAVLRAADRHPGWGGRKLKRWLKDQRGIEAPAPSTITEILRRHGRLQAQASAASERYVRFEHPEPNARWQMDFKGHVALASGRTHPLTVLDDHSRFNLKLSSCRTESETEVKPRLTEVFRRYGMPIGIAVDNGPPWGTGANPRSLTRLGVWLIELGVRLVHITPGHPQSNGKDERFHRSLNAELLSRRAFHDHAEAQRAFDRWREIYNHERPHESLNMNVPASRYCVSARPYPERILPVEYAHDLEVRKVDVSGRINYRGHEHHVSKALAGKHVGLRPDAQEDGLLRIYFAHQRIGTLDLTERPD